MCCREEEGALRERYQGGVSPVLPTFLGIGGVHIALLAFRDNRCTEWLRGAEGLLGGDY